MNNKNTLYNVFFPVWFLLIFPVSWLVVLPANFIIDSIVLLVAGKALNLLELKNIYKSTIIKVWIFGFLADIIGAGLLFLTQTFNGSFWSEYIGNPVAYNPWDNWYSFAYVLGAIVISAVFIYIFNMKISFKKLEISKKQKQILALVLAIFTAPYLFLLPSQLMYSHSNEIQFFTNHIIPDMHYDIDITYTEPETGDDEVVRIPDYKGYNKIFIDGINTADKVKLTDDAISQLGEPQTSLRFYNSHQNYGETIVELWFDSSDQAVYFQYNNAWYELKNDYEVKAWQAWQDILKGGLGIKFEIVDEAKLNNLLVAQALEKIYEDAEYTYYLSSMRSQYIFIEYFDDISGIAQRVDLVKALQSGLVNIEQLLEKGLDITAEAKELS
ncbi:MAG: hypothetical protein PHN47_03180 [Clostridia bacterium]|jgi:hypothetical protein|nr:hypothetical protein [Clostridia bacterium]MDD4571474.1 hypothetical protein [Clostridia bacterium]